MIKLTVSSNTKRKSIVVSGSTTPAEAFKEVGIDYTRGLASLDGCNLRREDLDKSLDSLGCGDTATLMSIIKNDNANN